MGSEDSQAVSFDSVTVEKFWKMWLLSANLDDDMVLLTRWVTVVYVKSVLQERVNANDELSWEVSIAATIGSWDAFRAEVCWKKGLLLLLLLVLLLLLLRGE